MLTDETGLVEGCGQTDSLPELDGTISVSNPYSDDSIAVVRWESMPCDHTLAFTFRRATGGYELVGSYLDDCPPSDLYPLPLQVSFAEPMPASSIQAMLVAVRTTPTP